MKTALVVVVLGLIVSASTLPVFAESLHPDTYKEKKRDCIERYTVERKYTGAEDMVEAFKKGAEVLSVGHVGPGLCWSGDYLSKEQTAAEKLQLIRRIDRAEAAFLGKKGKSVIIFNTSFPYASDYDSNLCIDSVSENRRIFKDFLDGAPSRGYEFNYEEGGLYTMSTPSGYVPAIMLGYGGNIAPMVHQVRYSDKLDAYLTMAGNKHFFMFCAFPAKE
jgi:hypothetical protein